MGPNSNQWRPNFAVAAQVATPGRHGAPKGVDWFESSPGRFRKLIRINKNPHFFLPPD
jgi:hypothetical protein